MHRQSADLNSAIDNLMQHIHQRLPLMPGPFQSQQVLQYNELSHPYCSWKRGICVPLKKVPLKLYTAAWNQWNLGNTSVCTKKGYIWKLIMLPDELVQNSSDAADSILPLLTSTTVEKLLNLPAFDCTCRWKFINQHKHTDKNLQPQHNDEASKKLKSVLWNSISGCGLCRFDLFPVCHVRVFDSKY